MANKRKTVPVKPAAVVPSTAVSVGAKPGSTKPTRTKATVSKPALTAQQRRAKAQAAQQSQARWQRTKRLLIVVAVLVSIVVVTVVVSVLVSNARQRSITGDPANQVTPPSAAADGSAIVANPSATSAALTVSLHLDYQCPNCKSLEDAIGDALNTLATNGDISLQYNIHTFLDGVKGQTKTDHNSSSSKAAIASTCADTVGAFATYHAQLFANQPTEEGTGYTDVQLRDTFASAAGITGDNLTTFQQCFDLKKTSSFVQNMNTLNAAGLKTLGATGTPTLAVNGKTVDLTKVTNGMTSDALLALLKTTAGVS